jgi:hypothetical protein
MDRDKMLWNLHEFDRRLWTRVTIKIGGASAAILKNALKRGSGDIDVVQSSMPLNDERIRVILDEVDKSPNERESWLNEQCRESIEKQLPENYRFDEELLEGEVFKFLRPTVISKADFVICKLAIDQHERRNHDLLDVQSVLLTPKEVERLFQKLDELSKGNHGLSLRIEGMFKQLRPEYLRDHNGNVFSNADDIMEYCFRRYGYKKDKTLRDEWQEDINNIVKKISTIVGMIDYKAGTAIESGNTDLALKDSKFRSTKRKEYEIEF